MAGLVTGENVRLKVPVGNGHIVAIFPAEGDPDLERAKRELLDNRFRSGRGGPRNNASEARVRFFDAHCQGIEGWQHKGPDGTLVDAMTLPDWRRRFPTQLKVSIVIGYFEEREVVTEEEAEALP